MLQYFSSRDSFAFLAGLAATLYKKIEGKPFTIHHCWIKLTGQIEWSDLANLLKDANAKSGATSQMDEVDETSGGVQGGLALAPLVPRSRGEEVGDREGKVQSGG